MKHRLPKPKLRSLRTETPADEIGRQTDSASSTRKATPPPLPFVNQTPSSAAPLPNSPQNGSNKPPVDENEADAPFSFLSGVENPATPETKPKDVVTTEPKGAGEISSILRAAKTTPTEQKAADSSASSKKKTRRVEPPPLPLEPAAKSSPAPAVTASGEPAPFLIQTRGLVKQYGGRRVVNGVDIHVRAGEVVGLMGKNGAGKTTTFYMIVGLVTPTVGHVYMGDEDVTRMPMYRRARRGIGYLPQEESIFRKLTVEENLLAILETLPLTEEQRDNRCDELLKDFGLEHVRENVAITLSGGEKRRVTIARALVTNPTLLLLDEPFAGVDPMAVHDIQEIILQLKKRGLGILITDHTVRETLSVVDRAYIIDEGRVLSEGSREFILNDPIAREIYLGERFSM